MKEVLSKYHLKTGLIVAALFPAVFILSDPAATELFSRFLTSFTFIFILWLMNCYLVDFRVYAKRKTRQQLSKLYISIILSIFLAIVIYLLIGKTIDRTGLLLYQLRDNQPNPSKAWLFLLLRIVFFDCLVMLIKYMYDSYQEKRQVEFENELLKRENLHARHETLKQQVNPHFLFNSLNTLRSLIKRDPEQAAEFTSELSSVYRYMLLHQDKKVVSLRDEIDFSKSYVYLLKIRFGAAINTRIEIEEEHLSSPMPPNTLQLLIENAVKHNALSVKKPLHIAITTRHSLLVVENNFQPKTAKTISSNIGLDNIRNRYLLLNGKEIIIEQQDDCFRVILPIIK
jgi:two-component system LytT family sensor kinase